MPVLRNLRGRAKKVEEVQQDQRPEKPSKTRITAQHPRTRAWVNQQEQGTGDAINTTGSSNLQPEISRPPRPKRSQQARTGIGSSHLSPLQAPVQVIGSKEEQNTRESVPEGVQKRNLRERKLPKVPIQEPESRESRVLPLQNPALSTWLGQLQTASPEERRSLPLITDLPLIGRPSQSGDSVDSSSSTSRASLGPSDDRSTVKTSKTAIREKALSWEKLRARRVPNAPIEDERSEHFKSVLGVKPFRIRFKDTTGLQSILKDFLQQCDDARPSDNSYAAIEDLSNSINRWRPGFDLVSITNRDFDIDISYCKGSNEAVLQRTVMTSIIDRWQLHELFVYNCEGQWSLPEIYRLPSRQRDKITLPKPDLAIFFKLEALTGTDTSSPVPKEISNCMRPDGGVGRCFPFVFIEAKRAAHDLETASMANMHSASQALFNIYVWMSQAGHEEIFFDSVRVFSIVLNAHEISVRIHRATPVLNSSLNYHFDDVISFNAYNRDQACLLVRNILTEYGEKELHGILQATFEEVSRQEEESKQIEDEKQQSKRKAGPESNVAPKRFRPIQETAGQPVDPTSSFGASGLEI